MFRLFLFNLILSNHKAVGFGLKNHRRHQRQTCCPTDIKLASKPNDNDDMIFFDDFSEFNDANFISRDADVANPIVDPSLSNMLQRGKQMNEIRTSRITKNFKCGNWNCRGFSLDKNSPSRNRIDGSKLADEDVCITQVAFDETATGPGFGHSAETIAVARSDGTVFLINLGTEYLTKFVYKSSIESVMGDAEEISSVSMTSKMTNEEIYIAQRKTLELGTDDISAIVDKFDSFEIMAQFQAGEGRVDSLLYHDDYIYTSIGPTIQVWTMGPVSSSDSETKMIPMHNLQGHDGNIVGLKTLSSEGRHDVSDFNLLVSASSDGSFALWDRVRGEIIYRCNVADEFGARVSITALDVDTTGLCSDDHIIYLGLSSGHVMAYTVLDLIQIASDGDGCPIPKYKFLAHDCAEYQGGCFQGVTALSCGGPGTIAATSTSKTSSVLITGGADGFIKQWEIIHQPKGRSIDLMHWPRLPSQRMKGRAHIFKGNRGPITCIVCDFDQTNGQKILAASSDGCVRYFDPAQERALFVMDGFSNLSSMCLDHEIFITNGMDEYVCIHDFDVAEVDIDESIDLDW